MTGDKGFSIGTDERHRTDAFLFGEGQSRVVVTITPDQVAQLEGYLNDSILPFQYLGQVTAQGFTIEEKQVLTSHEAKALYNTALDTIMN